MTISRQTFQFSLGASAETDTGPPFNGAVHQVRWEAISGDTGGSLAIYLQQRPQDTGDGFLVWTRVGQTSFPGFTGNFQAFPRWPVIEDTGTATPSFAIMEPVISAGEHLRVRITPGATGVAGKLYIWIKCD